MTDTRTLTTVFLNLTVGRRAGRAAISRLESILVATGGHYWGLGMGAQVTASAGPDAGTGAYLVTYFSTVLTLSKAANELNNNVLFPVAGLMP
jgi:hypothetical protein